MAATSRILVVAISVIVASAHYGGKSGTAQYGGKSGRPDLSTWKADQANKADDAAAKAAKYSKMSAVNKAVVLLEELRSKVMAEGEAEAATYNKFACFCTDTTKERLQSIDDGESERTSLIGSIDGHRSDRSGADINIGTILGNIKNKEDSIKQATTAREDTHKKYRGEEADLDAAVTALRGAIKTLKTSKKPSFAQLQSIHGTLRSAALLADVLGLAASTAMPNAVANFLQEEPKDEKEALNKVRFEDYKFHSPQDE